MPETRREFLALTAGLVGAAAAGSALGDEKPAAPAEGTPPAFGTAPPAGPEITAATITEAQKLVRLEFTAREKEQLAGNWRQSMAATMERRTGPRRVSVEDASPATLWNPLIPGTHAGPARDRFVRSAGRVRELPKDDANVAFATVSELSRWIESRALTAERLTRIYLERIERLDPKLRAVITPTPEFALSQAQRADADLAAGRYRGPLHGIPFGVKDLLDTRGIRTTWGAEPFVDRVPDRDAVVVERLYDAGAVLVAKLSLGALALNDVWFGGQTMNPWLTEEGSGGSSAGPGAATAAGLVAFAIGSETGGSIIDPAVRCGVTGLRPTFGRVARTGAMTLCWSLDKLGPMTRGVEDAMLVLAAINGPDAEDLSSLPSHLDFDANASISGLRVGYIPAWMNEPPATSVDRNALTSLGTLGTKLVEVRLPDWPYATLNTILFAEAAAAFERLTLNHGLDKLKMQVPDAWPNTFRQSRFLSAVDFVQADRLRRKVAIEMQRIFDHVDVLLVPALRDEILTITNHTGHPALVFRAGFIEVTEARSDWAPDPQHPLPHFDKPRRVPHGACLIGRLFDEGTLASAGLALERLLNVGPERPPGF